MKPGDTFRRAWVLLALCLAIGCGGSGSSGSPVTGNRWTFLVYLDADNNLDVAAPFDLNEMMAVGSTANVTVVVQLDTYGGPTRRFKVEKGGLTPLDNNALGELDMAGADTLRDFVVFGVRTFPADHYAIILWDHGAGWKRYTPLASIRAVFTDWDNRSTLWDNDVRNPQLPNQYVAQAIASAEQATGERVDVIGIDACNLATLEAVYEFRDVADFLVASQELVQGLGWDYRDLLGRLVADPLMTPRELAVQMVGSYRQFVEAHIDSNVNDQTISAIALGPGIDTLAEAVDNAALLLFSRMNDPLTRQATLDNITLTRQLPNPAKANLPREFARVASPGTYVDLYDFSGSLGVGSAVQDALDNVVVAEYHGPLRPYANGLSIVFYDLPVAMDYSVYDPGYRNFSRDALGNATGSGDGFINRFEWDEMMHAYLTFQYPGIPN